MTNRHDVRRRPHRPTRPATAVAVAVLLATGVPVAGCETGNASGDPEPQALSSVGDTLAEDTSAIRDSVPSFLEGDDTVKEETGPPALRFPEKEDPEEDPRKGGSPGA